jgi:hypothetical protein
MTPTDLAGKGERTRKGKNEGTKVTSQEVRIGVEKRNQNGGKEG